MNRPEIEKALNPAPRQQHPGYTAARENCVFYPVPDSGVLQINGPDRSEFLQRQTTNDLKQLSPGHTLTTILTSATGRVLDVLTLLDLVAQAPETGVVPGHHAARKRGADCRFSPEEDLFYGQSHGGKPQPGLSPDHLGGTWNYTRA